MRKSKQMKIKMRKSEKRYKEIMNKDSVKGPESQ